MENKKNKSLSDIGNRIPFTVPENYFEEFASNFESQISIKSIPIIRLLRPWLYMAAMFLGVLLMSRVGFVVYENNKTTNAENYELYVMSQVNDTEILDYYLAENESKN